MKEIRIGIITQITFNSVNFGNYLQTYALNHYINNHYNNVCAETLLLREDTGLRFTTIAGFLNHYSLKLKRKAYRFLFRIQKTESRLSRFIDFAQENIVISKRDITINEIDKTKFDALIVGSDVVWYQSPGIIDMPKFLPFYKNTRRRFAYAASFGNEFIPKENEAVVKQCLLQFNKIAVREVSAISLLSSIGINDVIHTCDPTMLLTGDEWKKISEKPSVIDAEGIDEYVFAYFLGNSEQQIEKVKDFFEKKGIRVLFVPYVSGLKKMNSPDKINLIDCSPQEWIWLINNAKYVITDSFHGLVFSVLFKKKFVSIRRVFSQNINSRIIDLLKTISAEGKMIDINKLAEIDNMQWESQKYLDAIRDLVDSSKSYIDEIVEA